MVGGSCDSRSAFSRRTRGPSPCADAKRPQRQPHLQDDHDHRPQVDRHHVRRRLLHLLRDGRPDGTVHPRRTHRPRSAIPLQRAVQPAVHHARHGDAAVLRHPDRVRLRQPGAAYPDRRPRRRLPASQRVVFLVVHLRCADRSRRLHHARRRRRLRLDGLCTAVGCGARPGRRWRPVDSGLGRRRSGHHPRRGEHDHHGGLHALPRHDHVPDADLHLEYLRHIDLGAAGLPATDRGTLRSGG